jgi:hypothetical protein
MHGKPGVPWVIAAGRIDEQHIETVAQVAHHLAQQRPDSQREKARDVAGGRMSVHERTFGQPPTEHRHRGGPSGITRRPGTRNAPRETHPRCGDMQRVEIDRTPWRRVRSIKPSLRIDQLLGRLRPWLPTAHRCLASSCDRKVHPRLR